LCRFHSSAFVALLMKTQSFSFCALLVSLLLAGSHTLRAEDKLPSAESVLQKMEATYAAAKSYSDTISVRFRNPDGAEGAQAECKVWFVRPTFFRIDGQSRRAADVPPKREVIWSNEETARSWSTTNPVTKLPKIQLAGSKMFGTYAYHVPTLLEAGYGGPRRLHQLESPALEGEGDFEGVECYRIRGGWQGDAYEVWVGKADSLVHKILANYKGYEMEEIHRAISVDAEIPKSVFEFAPENEFATPTPAKKTKIRK
jgi:hypothetical protein